MFDTAWEPLPGRVPEVCDTATQPSTSRFDPWFDLTTLSGQTLAGLVAENARERRRQESRQLRLAATWADVHDADPDQPYAPLVERRRLLGGEGTPEVAEFCVAEFAALQHLSYTSGRAVIADALDVRHRLPRLWAQVGAGEVAGWKARRVAEATRPLSAEAAGEVDHAISGFVETLPWPRFERILAAAVLEADPELAADRQARARAARGVWAGDSENGLKTLVAKANAGDVTWLMALVNRIAEILKIQGSTEPVGARRAQALGIIAQPAVAVALLAAHAEDPDAPDDSGNPDNPGADSDGASYDDDATLEDLLDQRDPEPPAPSSGPSPHPEASGTVGEEPVSEEEEAAAVPADPHVSGEAAHTSLDVALPAAFSRLRARDLRPRVVLYFHLAAAAVSGDHGVVRPADGDAMTLGEFREWLAGTGCAVQVRPVVVPSECEPVDGYEIPTRVREAVRLREHAEVWPFGTCTSGSMDLDHSTPFLPLAEGGSPGQTGPGNLGALGSFPSPGGDPRPVAAPATQPRRLPHPKSPRLGLGGHQSRHPQPG